MYEPVGTQKPIPLLKFSILCIFCLVQGVLHEKTVRSVVFFPNTAGFPASARSVLDRFYYVLFNFIFTAYESTK
jgi:hypothetical protein